MKDIQGKLKEIAKEIADGKVIVFIKQNEIDEKDNSEILFIMLILLILYP